jgi:hypothetical protein
MIIEKRRIRRLEPYLSFLSQGSKFVLGVRLKSISSSTLNEIGFTENPSEGEAVLPSAKFGSVSSFNAEGRYIIHKDRPMETAYRMAEWHWEEWRGRYDTEEQSKIVEVPYQRYPRTFVSPPSVELSIGKDDKGELLVISPVLEYKPILYDDIILHIINLFLEIFHQCEVFTEQLESLSRVPVRKLNWHILPPGRFPWEKLKKDVQLIIDSASEGNRPVITYRLETVSGYGPNFVAIGRGGFLGYVIFGFPEKNLYVLESAYTGNATYIFRENWEELSKLTKAQILSESLQEARLIHREGWEKQISNFLK